MKTIFPPRLKKGDEIRVIAPSSSLATLKAKRLRDAITQLTAFGFRVTFGQHVREKDVLESSSIASRVYDLHGAFRDKNVKAILCARGGFNVNELFSHLDYRLIAKHPKILCGFSDITALANTIYAKTGLVTYVGPNFSTFGRNEERNYTVNLFEKCVMTRAPFSINPSRSWWDKKKHQKNRGPIVLQSGTAEGIIIGGNLCTLNLLQGTEFMPSLKNTILFIEDDDTVREHFAVEFNRNLQSLIHQPGFNGVKALLIGRFQIHGQMTHAQLVQMIKTKKELRHMPVVANMDFGHTTPMMTLPIGGRARLIVKKWSVKLTIKKH